MGNHEKTDSGATCLEMVAFVCGVRNFSRERQCNKLLFSKFELFEDVYYVDIGLVYLSGLFPINFSYFLFS